MPLQTATEERKAGEIGIIARCVRACTEASPPRALMLRRRRRRRGAGCRPGEQTTRETETENNAERRSMSPSRRRAANRKLRPQIVAPPLVQRENNIETFSALGSYW